LLPAKWLLHHPIDVQGFYHAQQLCKAVAAERGALIWGGVEVCGRACFLSDPHSSNDLSRQTLTIGPNCKVTMPTQSIRSPVAADASASRPIDALTSIRGIAAWWIVIYHFREVLPNGMPGMLVNFMGSGYLAVDLFFELSGFVIALNYADKFRTISVSEIWKFIGLRLARVYPLHIFMLCLFLVNPIVIVLFSRHGDGGDRYNIEYFLLSVVLMQNWGFTQGLAWNIPAWSISTEWFAYLLFPALIWVSTRIARDVGRACTLALALLVVLSAGVYASGVGLGADIQQFGLFRCVVEFWVGICLYYLRLYRTVPHAHEGNVAALLAIICFAAYPILGAPDYLIMPLGFFFLIYSLSHDSGILATLLNITPLRMIGLCSYSTYLVHYFVKDWVNFLLMKPGVTYEIPFLAYIAVTAVASVILYRFIEVPGRRAMRGLILRGASVRRPYTKPV
jgi:peptidoglycan/LPS O-acetylase OafA/YrhL